MQHVVFDEIGSFFGVWRRLAFDTKNTTLCLYRYIYVYVKRGSTSSESKSHNPF